MENHFVKAVDTDPLGSAWWQAVDSKWSGTKSMCITVAWSLSPGITMHKMPRKAGLSKFMTR